MASPDFGKYRLIAELGHGGMADVFLGVVEGFAGSGFSKLVVLKRLRANLVDDPEFIEMLVDEARIAARLNHPNVVQTNEVGVHGKHYFIAMEYIDGQPLNRIQHRAAKAKLDFRDVQIRVILDMLSGLHHAHELCDYDGSPLNIVHRDVTPHNVLVSYEGQVKLVDFGIAKAERRLSQTEQGVVKGKVRYMAPEQVRGLELDRRADIFAAGIMLWEAATNKRFWGTLEDVALVQALLSKSYEPSPRAIDETVPESIDRICQKALAANRDDRYATAAEFQRDLERALVDSGRFVELRSELGPFVCELFAAQRTEMKEVIERQIRDLGTAQFKPVIFGDAVSSVTPVHGASPPSNPGTPSAGTSAEATRADPTTPGAEDPSDATRNLTADSGVAAVPAQRPAKTTLVSARGRGKRRGWMVAMALSLAGTGVLVATGVARTSASKTATPAGTSVTVVPRTDDVVPQPSSASMLPTARPSLTEVVPAPSASVPRNVAGNPVAAASRPQPTPKPAAAATATALPATEATVAPAPGDTAKPESAPAGRKKRTLDGADKVFVEGGR